jgi:hypothetical protein
VEDNWESPALGAWGLGWEELAALKADEFDRETAEILDIFTHEQYFWPFYSHYLPDHVQRCETAIRWATEHGYEPAFFHEGLLGGKDWG